MRALAVLFWAAEQRREAVAQWPARQMGAEALARLLGSDEGRLALRAEMAEALLAYAQSHALPFDADAAEAAAAYLGEELAAGEPVFSSSRHAVALLEALARQLEQAGQREAVERALQRSQGSAGHALGAGRSVAAGAGADRACPHAGYVDEAAALLLVQRQLRTRASDAALQAEVSGLLGEHARISNGTLVVSLDDFLARLKQHLRHFVPAFHAYQALRQGIIGRERETLRLSEFKARPLSSFVRNKLINDVYLGVIGDNLAKQMGTVGENKRSDLMGLLMMISPPGYGKTTLMEYVAHRLGLVFMKINGPALVTRCGRWTRPRHRTRPRGRSWRSSTWRWKWATTPCCMWTTSSTPSGVPAEVHLAVRWHPPYRRCVARSHPPTTCAARNSAW